MSKISISISQDLLSRLNAAAREANSSRSALLTQAARRYLEEKEEEKIREQQRRASREIDRIRESVGPWDGTAEVIKWRELH